MTSQASDTGKCHVVRFDRVDDAAAFVAALTRFLKSPRAPAVPKSPDAIEVWAHHTVNDGVELLMSHAAIAATTVGFGRPAVDRTLRHDARPLTR